jgi:RNA polymerase sigma-70 factor (ECF subfamily)
MDPAMTKEPDETAELLRHVAAGDEEALRQLFTRHRDRLKRVVHLRLSRRRTGRVDDSDLIQEAFLEAFTSEAESAAPD